MDYYKNEEIASVQFYTLRLAEDELMLYESCINFVIKNCPIEKLQNEIGHDSMDDLNALQRDIIVVLKHKTDPQLLSNRINECNVPILDLTTGPVCISAL